MPLDEVEDDDDENAISNEHILGSQLIDACKKGNFEECERCLGEGANPSYPDERKWDPLLWASYNGYAKICQLLIQKGATTAYISHVHGLKADKGSDPYVYSTVNRIPINSPLHWACFNGHLETANILLKEGYEVSDRDSCGNTALHLAATNGHVEVMESLLAIGMDVELKNNHGNTALDLATDDRTRRFLLNLIHRESCLSCEKEFDFKNWKFYCSLCKCGYCGDCTILEERVSKNDKELYIYKRYCRQCLSELKFSEEEVRRTLIPEGRNLEENDIPILQEVINKAINKDADNILVDESHKAYNSLLASVALEKVIDKVNQSRPITASPLIIQLEREINNCKAVGIQENLMKKATNLLTALQYEKKLCGSLEICSSIKCGTNNDQSDINRLGSLLNSSASYPVHVETFQKCQSLFNRLTSEVELENALKEPTIQEGETPELPTTYTFEDGITVESLLETLRKRHERLEKAVSDGETNKVNEELLAKSQESLKKLTADLETEEAAEAERQRIAEEKRLKALRRKKRGGKKKSKTQ